MKQNYADKHSIVWNGGLEKKYSHVRHIILILYFGVKTPVLVYTTYSVYYKS